MRQIIEKSETFYSSEEAEACRAQHKDAKVIVHEGHPVFLYGEMTYPIPEARPYWTVTWEEDVPAPEGAASIQLDPSDLESMRKLMAKYGHSESVFSGENELGESIYVSIFPDQIYVETLQSNGWARANIYWHDGVREEMFNGRWQ